MQKISLILLFIASTVFFQHAHAQSLSEKLGGVTTDFVITSGDTLNIQPSRQLVIRRAHAQFHDVDEYYGDDLGVGYASYHLEFNSEVGISSQMVYSSKFGCINREYYLFVMYDLQDAVVGAVYLEDGDVNKWINTNVIPYSFAFSIDLRRVPMILLDDTSRIDIMQMHLRCE